MSSQKGNSSRSRAQKHQNTVAYRNDKYGATVQVKVGLMKRERCLCVGMNGVTECIQVVIKSKIITMCCYDQ